MAEATSNKSTDKPQEQQSAAEVKVEALQAASLVSANLEAEKQEPEKQEPEHVSLGRAIREPDVEPKKPSLVKEGDMVRSIHGKMVDSITHVVYPKDGWTEVAQPSLWLDGQARAGKLEIRK